MIKRLLLTLCLLVLLGISGQALAHTPLCSCYENGDGTVTCEGGFFRRIFRCRSVAIRVKGANGQVLLDGKMDNLSEFSFDKPKEAYAVEFDAGEGHQILIEGKDIVE